MGKSDTVLRKYYESKIFELGIKNIKDFKNVAFVGFVNDNNYLFNVIKKICNSNCKFDYFDIQLYNFDINDKSSKNLFYFGEKKYDLIVCSRVAYFSNDLKYFVDSCYDRLNNGGVFIVDFGLGDHWRFDNYKVGWFLNRDRDLYTHAHEHSVYNNKKQHLWSVVWNNHFCENRVVNDFFECVKDVNDYYFNKSINDVVLNETNCLDYSYIKNKFAFCFLDFLMLWPESPQLYIFLFLVK